MFLFNSVQGFSVFPDNVEESEMTQNDCFGYVNLWAALKLFYGFYLFEMIIEVVQ